MTTGSFSFLLAALSAFVTASCTLAQSTGARNQECQIIAQGDQNLLFSYCEITNFSIHLPVTPDMVSIAISNVRIVDLDGCVEWLANMSQLSDVAFSGNDRSFLDCLTKFNRSLPLTQISNYGARLYIGYTSLPLDDWMAATFKTLFGNARYWDTVGFNSAELVTSVPKAVGDQDVIIRRLDVTGTRVSAIREHDLDGYQFVPMISGVVPTLYLYDNRICVVELAAFSYAARYNAIRIHMWSNPIDQEGNIDWMKLAYTYPSATALATHPVCFNALNTTCYQVIDTSYSGITIIQLGCGNTTTTTKLP